MEPADWSPAGSSFKSVGQGEWMGLTRRDGLMVEVHAVLNVEEEWIANRWTKQVGWFELVLFFTHS